jgi:hypothetical protein
MKITNIYGLPVSLVNAVSFNDHKKGAGFSVTEILKPIRMIHLQRRHEDVLTEDASSRIWALLGSAIHSILERNADKNSLQEQYLTADINGTELSGSPDLLDNNGVLSDWKITSVWASVYGSRIKEWSEQLNCYAWLYGKAGFPVKHAEVIAIYRDWSKGRSYADNYPASNVERKEIELWLPELQEAFITKRIADIMAHKDTPDNQLPLCSSADKWEKKDVYAVMKKGRKSAVRLHDTQAAADAMVADGKGDEVILRKGSCTRCSEYCNVNQLCSTYLAGSPPPVHTGDSDSGFAAALSAAKSARVEPDKLLEASIEDLLNEK